MNKMFYVDAAVGAGKTTAMTKAIEADESGMNYLIASKTINLLDQTAKALRGALSPAREVIALHSGIVTGSTHAQARRVVQSAGSGRVLLVTTATAEEIIPDVVEPGTWSLVMDEAIDPVTFGRFGLSGDKQADLRYIEEVFRFEDDGAIVVRPDKLTAARGIVTATDRNGSSRHLGLRTLASMVLRRVARCELLHPGDRAALQAGLPPEDGHGHERDHIEIVSFATPDEFRKFAAVVFVSALFERSMLWHLWRTVFGVEFVRRWDMMPGEARDTHTIHGDNIMIGHIMHESDGATRYNLERNRYTPSDTGEREHGQRVIDRLVETAMHFFEGVNRAGGAADLPLIQTNDRYGYNVEVADRYVPIPPMPHGINKYKTADHVAALAVTNPSTAQIGWMKSKLPELDSSEITQAFRMLTLYQAAGRCSIRDHGSDAHRVILTASHADAWALHQVFKGSMWYGQVQGPEGAMLPLASRQQSKQDWIADRIAECLADLVDDVRVCPLRRVWDTVDDAVTKAGMPSVTRNDKSRSLRIALDRPGIGWERAGSTQQLRRT